MVRRVLHFIREESEEECSGGNGGERDERDAFANGRLPSALAHAASASFGGGNGGGGGGFGGGAPGGGGGGSGADALAARAGGLLSRALRPGGRNVSLHNLLDNENGLLGIGGAGAGGGAEGIVSPTSPMSPVAAAAAGGGSSSNRLPPSPKLPRSGGATAATTPQQRKPGGGKASKLPPWAGRSEVIDRLNELIDELDEMDTAIAMKVRGGAFWIERAKVGKEGLEELFVDSLSLTPKKILF